MFSFSSSRRAAVVPVASRKEEPAKVVPALHTPVPAPPRIPLVQNVSSSSCSSSSLSRPHVSFRSRLPALGPVPAPHPYITTPVLNSNPSDISPSSIDDVLRSRPGVGRVVKARKPRLAKGSHYAKSSLRPENVPAQMRIAHWLTEWSLSQLDEMRRELPPASIRKVNEVLVESWAESTRKTQGAALLRFMEHCDELEVPECDRMPASSYLLSSFAASHAGKVSESCIDGWLSSLHAWHTINNAPWNGGSAFVTQVKKGAAKMAPPPRPPRMPVTIGHMSALQSRLDMSRPFDAAVWAVATCAFWGSCRLGELTTEFENYVDPKKSVTRVSYNSASSLGPIVGGSVSFRIPWTKTTRNEGATLSIVGPDSLSPFHAMNNHLGLTADAPPDSHLFSYPDADGAWHPMVKDKFMERCNEIWLEAGLEELDGHAFRIGGATELLMGGVPPHVVAMNGRWKSLAFLTYWRNVSEIIVNSFSSCYDTSRIDAITKAINSFCSAPV
ncbi:hypothetical protein DFP72DRAFT_814388 [Ephemerocybe angulata]|uniref:DNA breaking-rejoining enzyme n=1 Tax=Ephemerocybe angulata TaxID=980116 RepID=A0A8H6HVW0_9AGAR|nr:hypothetical protein DFP72DRAFT_814388 [Tulosesus angulatus]